MGDAVSWVLANGDGTADWVGLTGNDLAAVLHACANTFRRGRYAADIERLGYEAGAGCMAVWEAAGTDGARGGSGM